MLAESGGLEPRTLARSLVFKTSRRSMQLLHFPCFGAVVRLELTPPAYHKGSHIKLHRKMVPHRGIEPRLTDYKTAALPLC